MGVETEQIGRCLPPCAAVGEQGMRFILHDDAQQIGASFSWIGDENWLNWVWLGAACSDLEGAGLLPCLLALGTKYHGNPDWYEKPPSGNVSAVRCLISLRLAAGSEVCEGRRILRYLPGSDSSDQLKALAQQT